MASKTIKADNMAAALLEELRTYHSEVNEQVDLASQEAVERLVAITKKTAPKKTAAKKKAE